MNPKYCMVGLLFWAGCGDTLIPPVNQPPEELAISIILDPTKNRQKALVTTIDAVNNHNLSPSFVENAIVMISGIQLDSLARDSIDCRGNGSRWQNCYNYYSDRLWLLPGKSYELEILSASNFIQGETTIPGDFTIHSDGMKITWTSSAHASLYRIIVERPDSKGSSWLWIWEKTTRDTSVTVSPSAGFVAGRHIATVEALDRNLDDFTRDKSINAGVKNAYGVFGSVTVKKNEVYLQDR